MNYENLKTSQKKETSEVEITGDIPFAALDKYRKQALKDLSERADISGFRKGHIPEKILVEKFGEVFILEEAAELALKAIAPEIIEKEAPRYVGRPQIAITKLAPGNAVGFKILIGVLPEVKLPDYKKIAKYEMAESKKDEKIDVSEKEVDDVIEEIRGQRAHHQYHVNQQKATPDSTASSDKHEHHNHNDEEINKLKPEFTDEFVKTIGNFENVADFRTKAKENILREKENKAKDKKRSALLEKLVAETDIVLPPAVIENELQRMFAQFESDIQGMGIKIEDYLKHIKKTPDEIAKEWKPDAEKRAKLNIILEEIAKKEDVQPDAEAVKKEAEHIAKHYKDVDPIRAELYVKHMLTIEKAIQFLESQK